MDSRARFVRLFTYNAWASREVLRSLRASRAPSSRSFRLVGHVLAAEDLWLARIEGGGRSVVVWPDVTLDACDALADAQEESWRCYLAVADAAELSRPIAYTNSMGEPWRNTVEDILTHVLLHSAYHRGQIAADVRAGGSEPAYTDFIHCVRNGLIE
jgi:uncharacterized damage-inducible protein DinB